MSLFVASAYDEFRLIPGLLKELIKKLSLLLLISAALPKLLFLISFVCKDFDTKFEFSSIFFLSTSASIKYRLLNTKHLLTTPRTSSGDIKLKRDKTLELISTTLIVLGRDTAAQTINKKTSIDDRIIKSNLVLSFLLAPSEVMSY